jgi:hypothetical protein
MARRSLETALAGLPEAVERIAAELEREQQAAASLLGALESAIGSGSSNSTLRPGGPVDGQLEHVAPAVMAGGIEGVVGGFGLGNVDVGREDAVLAMKGAGHYPTRRVDHHRTGLLTGLERLGFEADRARVDRRPAPR